MMAAGYGYQYGRADEISPPSSPEPHIRSADRSLPGDVSPIDEDDAPSSSALSRNARSDRAPTPETRPGGLKPPQISGATTISTMQRQRRRKQSDAATRDGDLNQRGPPLQQSQNPRGQEAPRWDSLTGEPTGGARGRPSQVNRPEFAQGLGITSPAWPSSQNSPKTAPTSFGDRMRRMAKKAATTKDTDPAAGAFTSSRPRWRGASGRTADIEPVHDTHNVVPLKSPEKSSRRNQEHALGAKPRRSIPDGPSPKGQSPPTSPPLAETARTGPPQQSPPATADQRYPSPPLSAAPLAGDAQTVAARELGRDGLGRAHAVPSPTSVIRRKPPVVHTNHQHQAPVSSVYSQRTDVPQPSPLHIPDTTRSPAPSGEPWVPPPSRFSTTTYATSNTGTTDEPLDEDQTPVLSLPTCLQQFGRGRNPSTSGSNNNNRSSPVTSPVGQFMTSPFARASSLPTATATAPTPIINPALARALALPGDNNSRSSSRASDINKTLPPAPPEQSAGEAQDRVALLDARLRALANRRINLDRSIAQMTELMPTDTLLDNTEVVRKREAERRKVEALRRELADVRRDEYDLGLKLHRAYKRRDRETKWEPTTLWVRRVTG